MKKKFFLLFLLFFYLFSCKKDKTRLDFIDLNINETRLTTNLNNWAVTKFSNLKLRKNLDIDDNTVVKYLSQANILEIIRRDEKISTFEGKENYWYYVKHKGSYGWIFGTFIEIYNTKEEAERRCEEMLISLSNTKNEEKKK